MKTLLLILLCVAFAGCATPKEDTIKVPTIEWEYSKGNNYGNTH